MSAADRKAGKVPAGDTPDYFEKLLEKPCTNRAYPVKHLFKDCGLMKKWLSSNAKMGEPRKKPEALVVDGDEKQDDYHDPDGCHMIFCGPTACESKCKQKVTRHEVFAVEPATPAYLR